MSEGRNKPGRSPRSVSELTQRDRTATSIGTLAGKPQFLSTQFIEHLGYLNDGYDLYTFNMIHAPKPDNPDVAAIKGFEHRLEKRYLRKEGSVWYADVYGQTFPEELTTPEEYTEGAQKVITVNAFERNPEARLACITHHGAVCKGCGFDFEKKLWRTRERIYPRPSYPAAGNDHVSVLRHTLCQFAYKGVDVDVSAPALYIVPVILLVIINDFIIWNHGNVNQWKYTAVDLASLHWNFKLIQPTSGVWMRISITCIKQHWYHLWQLVMPSLQVALRSLALTQQVGLMTERQIKT